MNGELTFNLLLLRLAKLRPPISTLRLEFPVVDLPIGVGFLSKKGTVHLARALPDVKKVEVELVLANWIRNLEIGMR